jgi:hypothetical protein
MVQMNREVFVVNDPTVQICENSPEQVAYKLLESIAFAEGKALRPGMIGEKADRAYILETYWECLRVVQGLGTEEWDDADCKELEPSAVWGWDTFIADDFYWARR